MNHKTVINFSKNISISSLSTCQKQLCYERLTQIEIHPVIKSPGNDQLTKDFYQTFWKDFKDVLCNNYNEINDSNISARHNYKKLLDYLKKLELLEKKYV